jgi:hypothetical protein
VARPATAARLGAQAGPQWRGAGAGLALSGLSVILIFTVALLGPSLVEPTLPGAPGQPPWAFAVHPSPYLVVVLSIAAVAAGTGGLGLSMRAARRGSMPSPRVLLTVGTLAAVALAFVPPFGSSDHLSYAAYGRIAALGHDPYIMTPAALARLGDPVGRVVPQFQASPSVYGALATAGQELASRLGGTSVRLTVFVLSVLNVAAFAVTGLLLHWLTRGDRARQVRAALLWTANPLLLLVLVAGEHVDSQAVVFVIAALAAFSFCSLAGPGLASAVLPAAGAGALVGLGFSVKISMVLAGAGLSAACALAWNLRSQRDPLRATPERARLVAAAGGLAAGFGVVAAAALAAWGVSSLSPSLKAGSMTSFASPWRAVRALLGLGLGSAASEDSVKVAAIALAVVLLILLLRQVAGRPTRSGRALLAPGSIGWQTGPGQDNPVPLQDLAVMCAAAFTIAWLFAWPYVLPWYDSLGWPLLALTAWSELDWLLLARTSALALGYLAATGAALPGGLSWLQTAVREALTPVVLLVCLVLLIRAVLPARGPGDAIMTW